MSELRKVCKHGSLARSCQICELEAERDRLKEMEEAGRNLFDGLAEECSRLKAEVDIYIDTTADLQLSLRLVVKERDLWKQKAERLAEALRRIVHGDARGTYPKELCLVIAREALSEFEKGA